MSTQRHRLTGTVVSHRMQKTIVVRVERLARHTRYERVIRQTKSYKVHDEHDAAQPGDFVEIEETRPLSKEKRWRLIQIVRRAPEAVSEAAVEPAAP